MTATLAHMRELATREGLDLNHLLFACYLLARGQISDGGPADSAILAPRCGSCDAVGLAVPAAGWLPPGWLAVIGPTGTDYLCPGCSAGASGALRVVARCLEHER